MLVSDQLPQCFGCPIAGILSSVEAAPVSGKHQRQGFWNRQEHQVAAAKRFIGCCGLCQRMLCMRVHRQYCIALAGKASQPDMICFVHGFLMLVALHASLCIVSCESLQTTDSG